MTISRSPRHADLRVENRVDDVLLSYGDFRSNKGLLVEQKSAGSPGYSKCFARGPALGGQRVVFFGLHLIRQEDSRRGFSMPEPHEHFIRLSRKVTSRQGLRPAIL